ncbi:MAG: hypothetical protein K8U57_27630 [Planctomycetes bacterium]|nr:hypothetical protein [Planctomycetota bacterium]
MIAQVHALSLNRRNMIEAARQDYELAKEHFRTVCESRRPLHAGDAERFREAHERMMYAGSRYRAVLTS